MRLYQTDFRKSIKKDIKNLNLYIFLETLRKERFPTTE